MTLVATFEVIDEVANNSRFDFEKETKKLESRGIYLDNYLEVNPDEEIRLITINGEMEII